MPDDHLLSDSSSSGTTARVEHYFDPSATAQSDTFNYLNVYSTTGYGPPHLERLCAEIAEIQAQYAAVTHFMAVMQIFFKMQPMYEQLLNGAQTTLQAANASTSNPTIAKALRAVHASAGRVIEEFDLLATVVPELDGVARQQHALASELARLVAMFEEHQRSFGETGQTQSDSITVKLESPSSNPLSLFPNPLESEQIPTLSNTPSISDTEQTVATTGLLVLSASAGPGELAETSASPEPADVFLPVERMHQLIAELREEWQLGTTNLVKYRHAVVRRNTQPALKALMRDLPDRAPLRALAASLDPPEFFIRQCAMVDPNDLDMIVAAAVLIVALRFARSVPCIELNLKVITPSFDRHRVDQAFWKRYPNMALAAIVAIDRAGALDQLPKSLAAANADLKFDLQHVYHASSRATGNDIPPAVFNDKAEYQDEHMPAAAWPVPRPCDQCDLRNAHSGTPYKMRVCYAIVKEKLCAACVLQHNSSKHCPINLVNRSAPPSTS